MAIRLAFSDEFKIWWFSLSTEEQQVLQTAIESLPTLHDSDTTSTQPAQMGELRIEHGAYQYGILYVFDAAQEGILLMNGLSRGNQD